jgi:hypothetical protein
MSDASAAAVLALFGMVIDDLPRLPGAVVRNVRATRWRRSC